MKTAAENKKRKNKNEDAKSTWRQRHNVSPSGRFIEEN